MSALTARAALLLAAASLVWGCRKEEAPPQEDDRTLAKLRDEVDRVNRGGSTAPSPTAAPEDPNAKLAGLAAKVEPPEERQLKLPGNNPTVNLDSVAVKLTGLEAAHTMKGSGKIGLTSEDLFLRVTLVAENVGQAPAKLDLDVARVRDGEGKTYGIARDVQALVGTRQLARTWEAGERADLVLVFEVPPSAVHGPGLTLVLPATGGDVQLALR